MLKILQSGLTLIEDGFGRKNYAEYGVPQSGAFDLHRLRQANYLDGNDLDAPAFELHSGKLEFYAEVDTIVAVVGKGVIQVASDGNTFYPLTSFYVPAYAFTSISPTFETSGITYVAVSGLSSEQVLGSSSYDTFSKLGTAPVSKGDLFPTSENLTATALYPQIVDRVILETTYPERVLRVPFMLGPDSDMIQVSGGLRFEVESVSRSGIRFKPNGGLNWVPGLGEIASRPVFPGVIQIPASGAPIVLGVDAGVTGGYPVFGVVSRSGLSALSRVKAGDSVLFEQVPNFPKSSLNLGLLP